MIQTALIPLHRFDADLSEHRLIASNIGYDHALYGLWAPRLDADDTFKLRTQRSPRRYRATAIRDGIRTLDIAIDDAPFDLHDIQSLGEDLLLISARSQRRDSGDADANGRIYGADGRFKRAILLGDGIGALQTARDGAIWTGYFDEGVIGNREWTTPLGATGLVAWRVVGDAVDGSTDTGSEALYRYSPPAGTEAMTDCYAINVADDATWCYYYTGFPLVRIEDGRESGVWKPSVQGSHGFAVGDGYALFGGGYGDYDHIQLFALHDDGRSERIASFAPTDEHGRRLPGHNIIGRGHSLYFRSEEAIYRFDIGTALRLAREHLQD
jgi:hypothetical protein